MVKYFAAAFVITAILVPWSSGSAMLIGWALLASSIPVVWLLDMLPLRHLGLDPMSILMPFLIFAIGVSHTVQRPMPGRSRRCAAPTA